MAFRCMTSAIAGLRSHQTAMDVIGNNISNVDTYGFKSGSVNFRDTMYQTLTSASAGREAAGIAGVNPSQIGYGATAASITDNMTRGGESATGNGGDIYINGDGFLAIANGPLKGAIGAGTAAGPILPATADTTAKQVLNDPAAVKYTRIGHLDFDSNGYLTDGAGNYVLGVQYDYTKDKDGKITQTASTAEAGSPTKVYDSTKLAAIKYNSAAGKLDDVAIGGDGTITAKFGGQQIKIGQIALTNFASSAGLTKAGDSFYVKSDNSGDPTYSNPGENATGSLISGVLEASNVDLATEFSNMIMFERAYQANTKIISVSDEMYQTLVNMK